MDQNVNTVATPSLLVNLETIERNCQRMIKRARSLGVSLRPHMKTAKSAKVARMATKDCEGKITVSTLEEARYFASNGYTDITYAVGFAIEKLPQAAEIQRRYQATVHLLADNILIANQLALTAGSTGQTFSVFIEVDCGAGRGGVAPSSPVILDIAYLLTASSNVRFAGVLTHAGHSYGAKTEDDIRQIAEQERAAVVEAACLLRANGIEVPCVSVGSTPTSIFARHLEGVTEIRPGVYTMFDLEQLGLKVCDTEDIALSVLATVIGHNTRSSRILIDAGALALSKDLSAARRDKTMGYGLVCSENDCKPIVGFRVADVHQEHGFISADGLFEAACSMLPIGTRVRILPNHACLMAAPFSKYFVISRGRIVDTWDKVRGW